MSFLLIRGKYVVVGKQPDGDSIRFAPDDVALLMALDGPKPKVKPGGSVQLRLEGIDALETHYTQGHVDLQHQPLPVARAARAFLLESLGIQNVVWNEETGVVTSADDGTRGYILSRTFEKNGRPVAFAYAGDPPEDDGADVFLDETRLEQSVNYASLEEGFCYPTYYDGLFAALRNKMTAATEKARAAAGVNSVWAIDKTNAGISIPPVDNLRDNFGMLPKLFRRLSQYFLTHDSLAAFNEFLEADPDPCVFLPDADPTVFHRFIDVQGSTVRLTVKPEELMFKEKPAF